MIAKSKVAIVQCEETQRLRLRYSQALEDNDRAVDNLVLARGTIREDLLDDLRPITTGEDPARRPV